MIGDRAIDVDAAANAGISGCLFDPDSVGVSADCLYRCGDVPALERLVRELLPVQA